MQLQVDQLKQSVLWLLDLSIGLNS